MDDLIDKTGDLIITKRNFRLAFAWLEPKTRIRREGDQDDQAVKDFSLQREQQLSEEEAIRELKKLIKIRLETDPNSTEIALLKSALKQKKKRADNYWKNKKPSTKRKFFFAKSHFIEFNLFFIPSKIIFL